MKPLQGIRVLDLSRVLAGPMATQVLAELGAEVIKVERPGVGDESRHMEPVLASGESGYFFAVNRGKESIEIDLKNADGQQLLTDLASKCDVLVENFLPGTLDKMHLGYEDLIKINPRLIYVSNTGFGQSGPNSQVKGYDTIFQAMSGIMDLTGYPDGAPAKVGVPIADMSSSLWIVISVMTGLLERGTTGRGGHWDVAMMDVQLGLLAIAASRTFAYDEDPKRTGTEHPGRVPSSAFQCADGTWAHISCSDQHWPDLCRILGIDQETCQSYRTNAERLAARQEVTKLLTRLVIQRDRDELVRALRAADVPVGEVRTAREAMTDPQTVARQMVDTFRHPLEGSFPGIRTPIRKVGDQLSVLDPPPILGAQSDEVLRRVLGLSANQIQELKSKGAYGPFCAGSLNDQDETMEMTQSGE